MMIVKKVVSKHFCMEIDRLYAVNWSSVHENFLVTSDFWSDVKHFTSDIFFHRLTNICIS